MVALVSISSVIYVLSPACSLCCVWRLLGCNGGVLMLAPNTLLYDRYLIVHQIGQGGIGAIYEAIDQRLGNRVALKQTLVSGAQLDKAFEREAKLLARLHHPA